MNPLEKFAIRTMHALTAEGLNDIEKLNCIRLRWRQMAYPEIEMTAEEKILLSRCL